MHKNAPKPKETVDSDHWFWKVFDVCIEKNQLKKSHQRRLIAKYFLNLKKHVGAEDLKLAIQKDGCNIGIATVYRTLQFLCQAGLAEEKFFKNSNSSVFELLCPHSHHDHLVCKGCGIVIEFENKQIEKMQEQVVKEYGFTLHSHRLELFGYCKSCNKQGK